MREYYKKNREKMITQIRKSQIKNAVKIRKKKIEYYKKPINQERSCDLNKTWYQNHKKERLIYIREWRKKNKEKMKEYAEKEKIRRNIGIEKSCKVCGSTKSLQRHHLDYSNNGLNIITVCRACHSKIHRKHNPLIIFN